MKDFMKFVLKVWLVVIVGFAVGTLINVTLSNYVHETLLGMGYMPWDRIYVTVAEIEEWTCKIIVGICILISKLVFSRFGLDFSVDG